MKDLKIAVINGGNSAEADVSRSSAKGVIKALEANFSKVLSVELERSIATTLSAFDPDVVFPILHGPPGEDGTLQGFLEIMGYRYVGSNVHSSALAMDKIAAKQVFRDNKLPVADQCVVYSNTPVAENLDYITARLGESVVVKPASQGSAIGVTLIEEVDELSSALVNASAYDPRLLVEKRIYGREITVGVLDTAEGSEAFPVIEIKTPSGSWYDFDHRYTEGWSHHIMPAELTPKITLELQRIAVSAHQSLGCRDLSRADFVVSDDEIVLLEVNTLPGMTPTSLYPDGAKGFGLEFSALCKHLVGRAANREL